MRLIVVFLLVFVAVNVPMAVVAHLKGNLAQVGTTTREMVRRAGEPWTWAALFEPMLVAPVVFGVAAFGLAHPDSRWALWFYGDRRTARSRKRYG